MWKIQPCDHQAADELAQSLGLSPHIAAILVQKGFSSVDSAEKFLRPKLSDLPSPSLMKDMEKAVSNIETCLAEKIPILIYGDYDVDGTTGAAVLGLFLSEIGLQVTYCQPERAENGYGLHSELLEHYISSDNEQRAKHLLITVDCGITDVEAVERAKELGFSIIITDHHQPTEMLPDADAILNPWQPNCQFPFKHLAGVGVAFYFVMGIRSKLNENKHWKSGNIPNLRQYLDLVALGTIGDLVPLIGVNRILAKAGLIELGGRKRVGLDSLLNQSGIGKRQVLSEDVSFQLAPRINAAGRMGKADAALDLLIVTDKNDAMRYAAELDNANLARKEMEKQIFDEAMAKVESAVKLPNAIILCGEGWNPGILGIVASRFVRRFFRPAIILTKEGEEAKGSARSIPHIDILQVLKSCDDLLIGYGGHKAAAGLRMKTSDIQQFTSRFEETVLTLLGGKEPVQELDISAELGDDFVMSHKLLKEYFELEPFGKGNRKPRFLCETKNKLFYPKVIGSDHLKFAWDSGQELGMLDGIGFSLGHFAEHLGLENSLIAFSFQKNSFRGVVRAQLHVEDICINSTA